MASYQYTAHSPEDRQVISSICIAESPELIRTKLQRIGYQIDSIRPHAQRVHGRQHKRVKLKDLVHFCRGFSVMYGAGLPLLDCLESLSRETESQKLGKALEAILHDLRGGASVADAFDRHPKVFSSLFVNMIRAGEAAGTFDYTLSALANYLEQDVELKRSVRQALAYPITVVGMIFIVSAAIMLLVVPVFGRIYGELGIPLPGPTVALILLSRYAPFWISIVVTIVVGLVAAQRFLPKRSTLRAAWERVLLSTALVGRLIRHITLLRFIRTLSVMVKAGMPLDQGIGLAKDVAHSAMVTEASHMMQQSIRRGGTLAEAARLHNFFPPMIVQALATGEESGDLHSMLEHFATGLEQDVNDSVKQLVSMIEPILVVVLSFVIGFILLAIYLPIFDLMKGIKR